MKKIILALLSLLVIGMFLVSCTPKDSSEDTALAGEAIKVQKNVPKEIGKKLISCPETIKVPPSYTLKNTYVTSLNSYDQWDYVIYINSTIGPLVPHYLTITKYVNNTILCAYANGDIKSEILLTTTPSKLGVSTCFEISKNNILCN